MTKVISCGSNRLNQLWIPEDTVMSKSENGYNIVNTPKIFSFPDAILSLSTYKLHSIYIDKIGQSYQIGSTDPAKCFNIENEEEVKKEEEEIELSIEENNKKKQYQALSVVCGYCYSLFLAQEKVEDFFDNPNNYIFYYYKTQKEVGAQLIDTKGINPLSIYGGWRISAAIEKNDKILIFTPDKEPMQIVSFPPNYLEEDEYPVNIACLEDYVIVLTESENKNKNKKVFEYKLYQNDDEKAFKKIDINGVKNIAGSYKHCFLVTEDFHVYGKGNNSCGQLGLGKVTNHNKIVEDFVLIDSLEGKEIVAAYAGFNHSIFQSKNKELFVCGSNSHGQLFINDENEKIVTIPSKVKDIIDVSFCIAGDCSSIAVINKDINKLNVPNKTYKGKLERPIKIGKDKKE